MRLFQDEAAALFFVIEIGKVERKSRLQMLKTLALKVRDRD